MLGLRLDPAALAHELAPEARAALLAARIACNAISDRGVARDDAEGMTDEHSLERLDTLTREEAYRDAEALEAAATRFLAAGVTE